MLRRALALTRPGGLVAYATCTFAPEENEGVLNSIWPHVAEVVAMAPPAGLRISPGLAAWEGQTYRDDVRNAWRIWPHHNNSGGFFIALLRKLPEPSHMEPATDGHSVAAGGGIS